MSTVHIEVTPVTKSSTSSCTVLRTIVGAHSSSTHRGTCNTLCQISLRVSFSRACAVRSGHVQQRIRRNRDSFGLLSCSKQETGRPLARVVSNLQMLSRTVNLDCIVGGLCLYYYLLLFITTYYYITRWILHYKLLGLVSSIYNIPLQFYSFIFLL